MATTSAMADHIVALVPLDEYTSLNEFPPFQDAQAGGYSACYPCLQPCLTPASLCHVVAQRAKGMQTWSTRQRRLW